ncbi:MBL fold metallo-hydrolase [Cognatilysobacter terrigena]|uniref:MBL fold metallo-hydrolase n=1 Tax=Cognatilysobacter terrigena TaxID=2488749 RepID=UPI001060F5A6|nr:MBL fold metallo-hydrolase [Lysobacter terrigena]
MSSVQSPTRRRLLGASALAIAAAALPRFVRAAAPPLRIRRLGWAGLQLELGDDSLLIDPLNNTAVWGDALKSPLMAPESTRGQQFALVSHRHPDHFDVDLLSRVLGRDGVLACLPDVAELAAARGIRTRPAELFRPILLGDFTATPVPASDGYGDPQVSWVVSAGGRRVLHAGDTMWHGAWWHVGRQLGPFDVAFLPINGARFSWRQPASDQPAVLTPAQAVDAARILGARCIVPIHYGVQGAEGYAEQPDVERELRRISAGKSIDVQVLQPGDWLKWN